MAPSKSLSRGATAVIAATLLLQSLRLIGIGFLIPTRLLDSGEKISSLSAVGELKDMVRSFSSYKRRFSCLGVRTEHEPFVCRIVVPCYSPRCLFVIFISALPPTEASLTYSSRNMPARPASCTTCSTKTPPPRRKRICSSLPTRAPRPNAAGPGRSLEVMFSTSRGRCFYSTRRRRT